MRRFAKWLAALVTVVAIILPGGPADAKKKQEPPPPSDPFEVDDYIREPWQPGSCADIVGSDSDHTVFTAATGHLHFEAIIGELPCSEVAYSLSVYNVSPVLFGPGTTAPVAGSSLAVVTPCTAVDGGDYCISFDVVDADLVGLGTVYVVGTTSDGGGLIDRAGPLAVPDGPPCVKLPDDPTGCPGTNFR